MIPKPRLAKHGKGEQFQFFIIGLLSLIEDLVIVLSFGALSWELRAYALFELFEKD